MPATAKTANNSAAANDTERVTIVGPACLPRATGVGLGDGRDAIDGGRHLLDRPAGPANRQGHDLGRRAEAEVHALEALARIAVPAVDLADHRPLRRAHPDP